MWLTSHLSCFIRNSGQKRKFVFSPQFFMYPSIMTVDIIYSSLPKKCTHCLLDADGIR